MKRGLLHQLRQLARDRCDYCRLPTAYDPLPFQGIVPPLEARCVVRTRPKAHLLGADPFNRQTPKVGFIEGTHRLGRIGGAHSEIGIDKVHVTGTS